MSSIAPYISTGTYNRVMSVMAEKGNAKEAVEAAKNYSHWLPDFVDQVFKAILGDSYTSYLEEDQIKEEFAEEIANAYLSLKNQNYSEQGYKTTVTINKEMDSEEALTLFLDRTRQQLSLYRSWGYSKFPEDFGAEIASYRFGAA